MTIEREIFQNGSKTFYASSLLFPRNIREDVSKLYSFVRVSDDYVDNIPQQANCFYALRQAWEAANKDPAFDFKAAASDSTDERVIKNIIHISRKYQFDPAWINSFMDSMESDLEHQTFRTIEDTLRYMYGSAEVVGLLMARIMGLPVCDCHTAEAAMLAPPVRLQRTNHGTSHLRASAPPSISSLPDSCRITAAARLQGRAFQWLNFIRDIAEDTQLGRCYFTAEDLRAFGLPDLRQTTAEANSEQFKAFIEFQLERYKTWQHQAAQGFHLIPSHPRQAIQTSAALHNQTARCIVANPLIVFSGKIIPAQQQTNVRKQPHKTPAAAYTPGK